MITDEQEQQLRKAWEIRRNWISTGGLGDDGINELDKVIFHIFSPPPIEKAKLQDSTFYNRNENVDQAEAGGP